MRFGVLGTGMVGRALATRLLDLGHEVVMGSRETGNAAAAEWLAGNGSGRPARAGTFADAAASAEVVVNATSGAASLAALGMVGAEHLAGKPLIDVSNPLDFSHGMPPTLTVAVTDSLGEQIQRAFPDALVVKTLNTVNCDVMAHPEGLTEDHTMFVAGDNPEAKATVADLLRSFGWRSVLDLGGITAARGMEAYILLWLNMRMAQDTNAFNIKVVRG
jgi:8-hydroxy-5-deazaflavin:NADPH oxidoreductase